MSTPIAGAPIRWDGVDGPCPYCAAFAAKKLVPDLAARACDDCGGPIAYVKEMGGSGFESATEDHFHLETISGKAAWIPVMRELCESCFRADYFKKFPKAELDPVTSLPRGESP